MRSALAPSPAAIDPCEWVRAAGKGLGIRSIPGPLLDTLRDALVAPAGDSCYRDATLVASGVPLELSFSEASPSALRVDFEPIAVGASASERRAWTVNAYARLVEQLRAPRDDEALAAAEIVDDERFGAYLGAVTTESGLVSVNLYLPCGATDGSGDADRLARSVVRAVPALAPRFRRWSTGAPQRERVYLIAAADLAPRAIANALSAVGLAGRAAEVSWALTSLTGAVLFAAERIVISVAGRGGACEMKIELLAAGWPRPSALVLGAMRLLQERPAGASAFHRWRHALSTVTELQPSDVTAIGVRVFGKTPLQLGIYVSPGAGGSSR